VSELLDFLRGRGPDGAGRTLAQLWACEDDELERRHDFIQWMFPLPVRSAANPAAPALRPTELDSLREEPAIRANLRRSLDRMLAFYGFAWNSDRSALGLAPGFPQKAAVWLSAGNHNYLRLTRILRCLALAGETTAAKALLAALEGLARRVYGQVIGARSLGFWRGALAPPDDGPG
jgi:hypothetical protein